MLRGGLHLSQVDISPGTLNEMQKAGKSDTDLYSIMEQVHLEYLPTREGGWNTRKEWKDVLSYVPHSIPCCNDDP